MPTTVTPAWIDAIIGLVVLEFLALRWLLVRASAGRLVAPLLLFLASGAFLLAALRAALADAASPWVASFLLAAFVTHAACLVQLPRRILRPVPTPATPEA